MLHSRKRIMFYTAEEVWKDIEGETAIRVDKPWGFYVIHTERADKSVCVKTLVINSGHQISLQYHKKRREFWYISDESAYYELTLGESRSIKYGESAIIINKFVDHCIRNLSSLPLVIHETQYGFCDDEDIVRITDPYASLR